MKVSVCLAAYNGEKYIKEQIESILIQLSNKDELIISDDGSTDRTIEVIKSIADERIKLLDNSGNPGIVNNFSNALRHAAGDIIFLSDQDDVWNENKVKIITKELRNYDCVLHNAQLINSNGENINSDLFSIYKTRTGYFNNLLRNTYVGCCMAFRQELLNYILPIPSSIKMHDMWIALISEKKGTTKLINDKLINYRRHDNNASTTSHKSGYSRYFQLKYRLQMLINSVVR